MILEVSRSMVLETMELKQSTLRQRFLSQDFGYPTPSKGDFLQHTFLLICDHGLSWSLQAGLGGSFGTISQEPCQREPCGCRPLPRCSCQCATPPADDRPLRLDET